MSGDDISKFDQNATFITQNIVPLWRSIYLKLQEEGFGEPQALDILKTYIHASSGGRMEK